MRKTVLLGIVCLCEAFFIVFLLVQERVKPKPTLNTFVNESEKSIQIYTDKKDIGSIRFYDNFKICDIYIQDDNVKIFIGATEYGLKFFEVRDDHKKYRNITQFDVAFDEILEREESYKEKIWTFKLFEIGEESKRWDLNTKSWQSYVLENNDRNPSFPERRYPSN
jgi:hypothetical protein